MISLVASSGAEQRAARTFEAFHRLSRELVAAADADGTVVYASPALLALLGLEVRDVVARELWDLFHSGDAAAVRADLNHSRDSGVPRTSTVRVRAGSGIYRWVEITTANSLDAGVGGVVCAVRDVTEKLAAERALRASEARYRLIAETAEEGIWAIARTGETLYANTRMAGILGFADADDFDLGSLAAADPRATAEVRRRLGTRELRGPERYEIEYEHPDGRTRRLWVSAAPLRGEHGTLEGSLAMVSDITEIREAEAELQAAALRDQLTRLPNRPLLVDQLECALSQPDSVTSVVFVDLDNFKLVNDSRGHDVGDQLLVAVASRLVGTVRASDTVARFGGDEFVVVCPNTRGDQAAALAEEIVRVLGEPFDVGGGLLHAPASVGVATAVVAGTSAHDLLRYADTAMYSAKAAGRGRVRVFDPTLAADVEDEYLLAADLRAALADGTLDVHYQPIIGLDSGLVTGVEALLRWFHPSRGAVSPGRLVGVAERAGLAAELDRWVLRRALADMSELRRTGSVPPGASIAVNLSARNLSDTSLDRDLLRWVERAGLPPAQVCLEITETAIMADRDVAVALLGRLRHQGFRVAVDDFGTGYSSLAYLRDLPITTLKIDRSFIADITTSGGALAIVVSIIELARAVGVDVVAEGVEAVEQSELLRRLGCSAGQGWLWSRARPPADIPVLAWDLASFATVPQAGGRRRRRTQPVTNEHGLRRLLDLHAAGASHLTIAAALNSEGFRTPTGFRWHAKSVARAITEVAYPALAYRPSADGDDDPRPSSEGSSGSER